jgi:hypothetical protein
MGIRIFDEIDIMTMILGFGSLILLIIIWTIEIFGK